MTTLSLLSGSPSSIKNELSNDNSPLISQCNTAAASAKPAGKTKPRKRVNTAEKRHQHNAIERQRRETLNGKFLSLARLLPSLATVRRPSKSAIVNGSISHLVHQRDQRLLAAKLLQQICAQHDQLLSEVNEWRKVSGYAPKDVAHAWTDEMDEVCSVEKEVFGNFTHVEGDDNEDDDENDMPFDQNMSSSFGSLITPRSSADGESMSQSVPNGIFISQPQVDKRMKSTVSGLWPRDFAFSSMSSSTSSLPFSAFMSDSIEQSSTGSSTNSVQGNVLTPPTTADGLLYTHTPSPRSSQSLGDDSAKVGSVHSWSDQQNMFPQTLHPQQHQSSGSIGPQSMPAISPNNQFNNNMFHMFGQQGHPHPQPHGPISVQQTQMFVSGANGSDAFTQSLLASMFPSQGVSVEQVDQWRKLALAGINSHNAIVDPSMPNAQPGAGIRMRSIWEGQNHAVEGF